MHTNEKANAALGAAVASRGAFSCQATPSQYANDNHRFQPDAELAPPAVAFEECSCSVCEGRLDIGGGEHEASP